jgi:hypothetical protein
MALPREVTERMNRTKIRNASYIVNTKIHYSGILIGDGENERTKIANAIHPTIILFGLSGSGSGMIQFDDDEEDSSPDEPA